MRSSLYERNHSQKALEGGKRVFQPSIPNVHLHLVNRSVLELFSTSFGQTQSLFCLAQTFVRMNNSMGWYAFSARSMPPRRMRLFYGTCNAFAMEKQMQVVVLYEAGSVKVMITAKFPHFLTPQHAKVVVWIENSNRCQKSNLQN